MAYSFSNFIMFTVLKFNFKMLPKTPKQRKFLQNNDFTNEYNEYSI